MIPKDLRFSLRLEPDFFQRSRKVFLQTCSVFWKKDNIGGFVVIVPKKQIKLASHRNRLKRRVMNEIYQQVKNSSDVENFKLVFVIKKHPQFLDLYKKDIQTLFEKINLVK